MLMHARGPSEESGFAFLPLEEALRAPLGPALKFSLFLSLSLSLSVPVLSAVPITRGIRPKALRARQ